MISLAEATQRVPHPSRTFAKGGNRKCPHKRRGTFRPAFLVSRVSGCDENQNYLERLALYEFSVRGESIGVKIRGYTGSIS